MEQNNVKMAKDCVEIRVQGIVQGVGFRPFIYRLATGLGIKGQVSNTEQGVIIKAEGEKGTLKRFIEEIKGKSPPLSKISSVHSSSIGPCHFTSFEIVKSKKGGKVKTEISPDVATCNECLKEILDPKDRRHGYAFTNCTNCGPRYTIIESLPYDRPNTSMKHFPMCKRCKKEYEDPLNRRFHAQPNACPDCGPHLFFVDETGSRRGADPLRLAVSYINADKIVAIKGLGGFHLACSAFSDRAISRLRRKKMRPYKPFAIMVKEVDVARRLALLGQDSEELLCSFMAPIVLFPKRTPERVSHLVAPNVSDVGIMLPYTPLHHLLFRTKGCPDALVMTSGNPKDEPLCTENKEALERLSGFVDAFVLHDRDIFTGVDDSVIRNFQKGHFFIRRSRGYVPAPIDFPGKKEGILGAGAELKNTFCLTKAGSAYLSQHIGNLVSAKTFSFYKRNIRHLADLLELKIRILSCDLHPDYLSTRFCLDSGLPVVRVQHHFAHAASVMAEHMIRGPVLAICLDGTGLGTDGTIWGGEVLVCTRTDFKRLGRIRPFPLPGGDACAKSPWRAGLSLIFSAFGKDISLPATFRQIDRKKIAFVKAMIEAQVNTPLTSSCGRLFDAVSALSGICMENTYEAQAAMELEALCLSALSGENIVKTGAFERFFNDANIIRKGHSLFELDWKPFLEEFFLQENPSSATDISINFHAFLTAGLSKIATCCLDGHDIETVVISGGCMQNRVLLEGFVEFFRKRHISCLTNEKVPSNDGGICLGQAFVASGLENA